MTCFCPCGAWRIISADWMSVCLVRPSAELDHPLYACDDALPPLAKKSPVSRLIRSLSIPGPVLFRNFLLKHMFINKEFSSALCHVIITYVMQPTALPQQHAQTCSSNGSSNNFESKVKYPCVQFLIYTHRSMTKLAQYYSYDSLLIFHCCYETTGKLPFIHFMSIIDLTLRDGHASVAVSRIDWVRFSDNSIIYSSHIEVHLTHCGRVVMSLFELPTMTMKSH